MHETPDDLARLQAVLDDSYAHAGAHLQRVHTPDRRLDAAQVVERLGGMCLLTLATTTADGRPLAGPVDGFFYRGRFWFGSSPDSVRFTHLRSRPSVSACFLPGEHLSVTVHGEAHEVPADDPEVPGYRDYVLGHYGPDWWDNWEWGVTASYARITPRRMLTFHMDPDTGADDTQSGEDRADGSAG